MLSLLLQMTQIHVYCMSDSNKHNNVYTHTHVRKYIHIYCLVWMFSDTEKWLLFERRKVVFLWRDQNSNQASQEPTLQKTDCPIQTDGAIDDQAKNLNSTAHPYDERTFIHICGLLLMLWHRETHITHKKDWYIIVYLSGVELNTSRLRQHRQLPVIQHVRFMPQTLCQKHNASDMTEATLDNQPPIWNA